MLSRTIARGVCTVFCLTGLIAANAAAQQPGGSRSPITAPGLGNPAYRGETHLTFSGPVQLPGVALDAGEYAFHVADPAGGRNVVQVTSADGKKAYGMFDTRVVSRTEIAEKPEVSFLETSANIPPAIKTVWFAGQSNGREFMYSKEQTDKLAMSAPSRPAPAQASSSPAPDAVRPAPAADLSARNEPREPVGTSGLAPQQTTPVAATRDRLPKTGSTLPLVTLLGGIGLAGAVAIRTWRLARTS